MSIIPKKLVIYYGYPSLVNGASGNLTTAADVFNDYDMVVFGAGLEDPLHPDHNNTQTIINNPSMVNTECYGYLDSTIGFINSRTKIDLWKLMGVKGIFCDRFGFDFGMNRCLQNSIVNYIHSVNLKAFLNSFNPDDTFSPSIVTPGNPDGLPCVVNINDWYLAESFQIVNGVPDNTPSGVAAWELKAQKMINYNSSFGVNMATTTTNDSSPFDTNKWNRAYYMSVLYGFDACCWGEEFYSASGLGANTIPFRARLNITGVKHTGSIIKNGTIYERQTNIGQHIDISNNSTSDLLN